MNWLNHLSGGSCGGSRAILPPFPRITVASHPTYGTIAPAFTESCPSGRRSTIGNRVGAKSVSRVQIPDSPPELSAARIQLDGLPFSLLNGGVAEWLNAAVSKTVYGYSPYEGSNPSSSAIICSVCEPRGSFFYATSPRDGSSPPPSPSCWPFVLGGPCEWLKQRLMMCCAREITAAFGIHSSHA